MNLAKHSKLTKYLLAKEYIGGLEISDAFVHFVLFDPRETDKIILTFESELEPGVVANGELKKPDVLRNILLNLRHHPNIKKIKHLYTILSLQSNLVYNKIFDLPTVDYKSIMSAVELNMKMLSPIPFEKVYSDWEILEKPIKSDSFKLRVFSVFAEKRVVDPYIEVLNQANIIPLATEFAALSLERVFSTYNIFEHDDKNYLGIYLSSNGMDFVIGNKKGMEFNFFQDWKDALHALSLADNPSQEMVLTKDNFLKIFNDTLQKIITFYFTRFQESIEKVILLSPIYFDELKHIIEERFNLVVENPVNKIPQVNPAYYIALGAALRGLIPRADDVSVSLMAIGTEQEYRTSRTINFVNFWLKAVAEVLIIVLIVSLGFNVFLQYTKRNISNDKKMISANFDPAKLSDLNQKAHEFNLNVGKALEAKANTKDWSKVFENFYNISRANNITLKSWIIPLVDLPFSFNGISDTQTHMIQFRDGLLSSGNFTDLDIPLQSIIQQKNQVEFNLKGKIKL